MSIIKAKKLPDLNVLKSVIELHATILPFSTLTDDFLQPLLGSKPDVNLTEPLKRCCKLVD